MIPDVKNQKVEGRKSAMLSLCLFMAILGCTEHKESAASFSEPVYSKQYRQHSATAIVTLSTTNIPTSGSIQLMIDVHVPPGTEVILPEPGNFIHPFSVADGYIEPPQTLPNGKRLHRRVWQLTPGLSGDHIFQSMEIIAGPETVHTDPIHIHVQSLLPAGTDSLEIKDIAESIVLLPEEQRHHQIVKVLLGVTGGLTLLFLPILLRRRRPQTVQLLNPYEAAWLALENLPEDELEKVRMLHAILLQFAGAYLKVPTAGKTLNEIVSQFPKSVLLGRRYLLEKYLYESEQARFSHKLPSGFSEELEHYIRDFILKSKEAECD